MNARFLAAAAHTTITFDCNAQGPMPPVVMGVLLWLLTISIDRVGFVTDLRRVS